MAIEVYLRELGGVWFGAACSQNEILATGFAKSEEEARKGLLSELPQGEPGILVNKPSKLAAETVQTIVDIYDGKGAAGSFRFAYSQLPAYTLKVTKATLRVPVGYVTTYAALAEAVGGGPRAVGNVMASNRFWPIVPCHRVVKSDWTLGGYGGGLKTKVEMLTRESRGFKEPTQISTESGTLRIYPVEFVIKKLPKAIFG